jgi:branched-chain amino acid transport system ATP-binding protein
MNRALEIIRNEHRSLAAVLNGLAFLVDEIRAGRQQPDFNLLQAMLRYIEDFPEKLHHPKEEEHLFRILRERDPASGAVLDGLSAEHRRGAELIAGLESALARWQSEGGEAFAAFAAAVESYAKFHWEHMRKEEDLVLPRATETFLEEDWAAMDAAFSANPDPIAGLDARREMRELFRRIVSLAPPPLGVGPSRR